MANVGAIGAFTDPKAAEKTKAATGKNSYDVLANENTFMQLLVTQMKNQDPLNPLDGTQYISQLAQLTSTEQISKMAESMKTMSAVADNLNTSVLVGQLSSMIGKDVHWTANNTVVGADGKSSVISSAHKGVAMGVSISDGVPSLVVKEGDGVVKVNVGDLTLVGQSGLEK